MSQKDRSVLLVLLLHRHCEPERRPVPPFDCQGDEGPQLEGLQFVISSSFEDGYVDVEIGDLLVDRVLVLLETSRLELGLCVVASVCRHRRICLHKGKEGASTIFLHLLRTVVRTLVTKHDDESFFVAGVHQDVEDELVELGDVLRADVSRAITKLGV